MKPFRERNHTIIGLLGFALIAALLVGAFRADRLPIIGGGDIYSADFTEVGSLRGGDEVRVAGVTVGKVDDVELRDDTVRVTFRITGGDGFGDETGAAVRIRTLLGATFLALTPDGEGQMAEGSTIPISRTVPPYDVVEAFSDLSETTDALDVDQLATALETLGEVSATSPVEFQAAITGLSDVSANLAARDQQINGLLTGLESVAGTLASRNAQLETLFTDSSTLFAAITARRDAIHTLLVSTQTISNELVSLVDETEADLGPALTQLQAVTDVLARNQATLDEILRIGPTFLRVFSQALGTGPWFDNLLGLGTGLTEDLLGGLSTGGTP